MQRLIGLLVRTNDIHPGPWAGVYDQAEAVELHDRRNEVEPESNARRSSNLVGAIKSAQHGLTFQLADPRTRIRHAQRGFQSASQHFKLHFSISRRKLDRIVDEVDDGFQQQVTIATHAKFAGCYNTESNLLFLG